MQRIFKYGHIHNMIFTPYKELNILMSNAFYVIIYRHYKLLKWSVFDASLKVLRLRLNYNLVSLWLQMSELDRLTRHDQSGCRNKTIVRD